MNSQFIEKVAVKLDLNDELVTFVMKDYFLNLRRFIGTPSHARILTPIGTFYYDYRVIWASLYNIIKALRNDPKETTKTLFRELWQIKQLMLQYKKLTYKINAKRYKSQQNKTWNQGTKFR